MTLANDAEQMILQGLEPPETVTYCAYKEIPRTISATVHRPVLTPDFLGGAENTIEQYELFVVNDPAKGIVTPQEGKDQVIMKVNPANVQTDTFRVVSAQSYGGGHLLTVRL